MPKNQKFIFYQKARVLYGPYRKALKMVYSPNTAKAIKPAIG